MRLGVFAVVRRCPTQAWRGHDGLQVSDVRVSECQLSLWGGVAVLAVSAGLKEAQTVREGPPWLPEVV